MFVNRSNFPLPSRPQTSATSTRQNRPRKPLNSNQHTSSTSRLHSNGQRHAPANGIPQLKRRGGSSHSANGTGARPPTAPSRIVNAGTARGRFKFDDKTYISVLKSDILRLQRKLDEIATQGDSSAHSNASSNSSSSNAEMQSSDEIERFLKDFEFRAGCKTQNQMTKAALMDVLFEKMQLMEKSVLEHTCLESEGHLKKHDSNLSRIGLFFNLIEKTMHLYENMPRSPSKQARSNVTSKPLVAFEMPSFKVSTPPDHKHKYNAKENKHNNSHLSNIKSKDDTKRLKKQVADLKKKCQRLKDSEKDLRRQLKEAKSQSAPSEDLNSKYKNRIDDLESTVSDLQSLNDKLQSKYDKKSKSASQKEKELKSSVGDLKSQIASLKKEKQASNEAHSDLESKVQRLEKQIAQQPSHDDNNVQLKRDVDALKKKLDTAEKKHAQKQEDADVTISKLQNKQLDLEKKLKEKEHSSNQAELLQKQCDQLRQERDAFKKRLDDTKSKSADDDVLINTEKELMDLKDQHKMKLKAHENEVAQLKSRLDELESDKKKAENAHRELKLSASTNSRELKRLREIEDKYIKLKAEMEKMSDLQQQDEESLNRLSQMQTYLEKMESEHQNLKSELDKQVKRNEVLKNCDALYQESMQELRIERQKRKDLEEKSVNPARLRRLNEKVMDAEQVIRKKNEKISEMEKGVISRMKKEIQRLLDDIESRDQRIERLEEKLSLHKREKKDPNKPQELSEIMDHIEEADHSLNDVLVEELKSMRVAFEDKLKKANGEIDRIKKFHKKQLLEMQETVSKERKSNERKLRQLRDRCEMLTKAVEAIKRKYA